MLPAVSYRGVVASESSGERRIGILPVAMQGGPTRVAVTGKSQVVNFEELCPRVRRTRTARALVLPVGFQIHVGSAPTGRTRLGCSDDLSHHSVALQRLSRLHSLAVRQLPTMPCRGKT